MLDQTHHDIRTVSAVVHAGGRATAYRRVGAGVPVLLLLLNREPNALGALSAALAHRFRVITTDLLVPPEEFCTWLVNFLDGLGIHHAVIVTWPGREGDVLRFAARYAERLQRILVLDESPAVGGLSSSEPFVHRIAMRYPLSDVANDVAEAVDGARD